MNSHTVSLCIGLLIAAAAPAAAAQTYSKQAELELAATGDSFAIGDTVFRLAPAAVVRKADAAADAETEVLVSGYVVDAAPPAAAADTQNRRKRSIERAGAGAAENLGAAVSSEGQPVVIAPELNVYFERGSSVEALARDTGGRLLYSSATGGKATIGYASVADAMAARQRILGRAGIKEASPRLVKPRRVAK